MNEQEVQTILENNRYYNEFFSEFNGKFALIYQVGGAYICFHNQVGGFIAPFIIGSYEPAIDVELVQEFAAKATRLLRRHLNE